MLPNLMTERVQPVDVQVIQQAKAVLWQCYDHGGVYPSSTVPSHYPLHFRNLSQTHHTESLYVGVTHLVVLMIFYQLLSYFVLSHSSLGLCSDKYFCKVTSSFIEFVSSTFHLLCTLHWIVGHLIVLKIIIILLTCSVVNTRGDR